TPIISKMPAIIAPKKKPKTADKIRRTMVFFDLIKFVLISFFVSTNIRKKKNISFHNVGFTPTLWKEIPN
ncbi:MAG: hypothetical protein ACKVTZ_00650, partial [Bacteroidia bacterium]